MEAHDQQNSNWCYGYQQGLECTINVKVCTAPEGSDMGYSDVFNIETAPSGHPFKVEVQRTYQDFLELDEFLRTSADFSRMSGLPQRLPQLLDGDTALLSSFLQQLLLQLGGFFWNCPRLLCFLDDTHGKQSLRDAQVGVLNRKLQDLSTAYRTLEIKLYDAQDTWETISMRMLRLETLHMDHLARHEEREEAADFAEPDYEKSIAIHNENNSGDIEDYFDPNGSDFCLAPDSAVSMAPTHPESPRSLQGVEGTDGAGDAALDGHMTAPAPATGSTNDITNASYTPEQTSTTLRYHEVTAQVESGAPHFLAGNLEGRAEPQENAMPFSPSSSPDTETDVALSEGMGDEAIKENSAEEAVGEEAVGEEAEKSDLEQLRERVADVVPERRPAPPRVHSYKSCKDLHVSIIPSNVNPDWRDVAVDSILSLLKPYDAQLLYRSSARAFLGRAVRHSLNAKLFESGLHALHAFLPDDPIRLTVLLWRGNSTNWLANLSDKLRVLEQPVGAGRQGGPAGISGVASFEDDNFNDANNFDIDNEPKPTGEHMITNINPSTNNGHSRMLCTIDTVPVEIMPNARSDLCFLALVEEIAQLVGKNDLFKNSLLLIRGWWTYESSGYVSVSTKSFFSDSVLCVLVCSIFNQYHAVINQPLQALCVFLAEYSDVKWSDVAVTLQGVVPFHSNSVLDNQPWLREPLPSELVTSAILQRHCDFYHMSSASNSRASATPQVAEMPSAETLSDSKGTRKETTSSSGITTVCSTPYSSSETPGKDIMTPCFNTMLSSSSTKLTPPSSAPPTPGGATPYGTGTVSTAATVAAAAAFLTVKEPSKRTPSDSHCYSPSAVRNFQKRVINVVHPLTNANMISTSLTLERVTKISQIFETGARDLGTALKLAIRSDAEADRDQLSLQSHFNSFFRNTLGRFAGGWRPDVFSNTLPKVPHFDTSKSFDGLQDLSNASSRSLDRSPAVFAGITLTDLFSQIRYIDLVLVGRVSESALLSLSLDILVGRGVLPVGEIGKSLQDIAPTRNLSGKIKEKYGGLKKFLERYPEEVVICADHPFNPHVFLRKPLNRTDLELIAKGIIPPHLRKAMALRNKMRGGAISGIGQDGHSGSGSNYHMGALHGMEGNIRHMNPNMERNMNSGGAGMNGYGSHGNMGGMQGHGQGQGQGQGMNWMNHQMQQQAYKSQQQALALAQQQLFSHQQAQSGQFRGPDPSHGHSPQNAGQTGNQYFFPMRDGDQMVGPRSDQVLIRGPPQVGVNQSSGGLGGALLGQDFSQSQGRRPVVGGMNGMGLDLSLNAPLSETYGSFGPRRGLSETSHSALLGSDGLGLGRSLSTFNSVIDGGQARRYGELSLSGSGLGGLSSDNLTHDRSNSGGGGGGASYELSGERPIERRFSERDHTDGLAAGPFNPSLSLNSSTGSSAPASRRLSASMHQAAKNFSERDKIERDRALGIEPWDNPLYTMDRDAIDDRLRERDRYAESDFNLESTSELFATSTLGSNSQMLSDDREREREREAPEYYDPRTQRAYQQSVGRDSYLRGLESPQEHHTHHQGGQPSAGAGPSLFLQQREDEMLFEQEYSMRDRDRQHQLQRQQEEDDQHQRLILQNQQAGTQRQSFRSTQNVFDPKKWI